MASSWTRVDPISLDSAKLGGGREREAIHPSASNPCPIVHRPDEKTKEQFYANQHM